MGPGSTPHGIGQLNIIGELLEYPHGEFPRMQTDGWCTERHYATGIN
jgi:hypothetical protein